MNAVLVQVQHSLQCVLLVSATHAAPYKDQQDWFTPVPAIDSCERQLANSIALSMQMHQVPRSQ